MEASQIFRDKVKYASFRERLIQQEMDIGNYDEVIRLAFDGERMDRDYLGLLTGWIK
ncbi:hypothetical protein QNH10_19725 [Sporosarcina thermotolerans]|uniref:hypothetical protein n=1 Tax=Sporosarcina thermotolerans TaxID=633404 RepID=UPI0024BC761E|nr:hypothetical protein [Sporosarcina thermotolerans]WHT48217.1 hypothetical protein QNH10_19725 [Sporosarcina thermotolerans]